MASPKRNRSEATHPHELELQRSSDAQNALMVAVLPEGDDLAELSELLDTAQVSVVGQIVQHLDKPHPNTYVGEGKLQEIKALAAELDANVIVTDDELSPRQERNLESILGLAVLDRTAVILDIFATHAGTAEGKLQVELAQLQYNLARMRGLWTHLDRLGVGGVGTRGPGETQIETDRRLARDRISKLRKRLKGVKATRAVMRAERNRSPHLPSISLVGYTNAGKSTLLNALTGATVSVQDQLFHTLDPTTRTMRWNGRTYLATDTVGFIRKLPHQLVDAFGATLEETVRADLLLHVVDAGGTDEEIAQVMEAVQTVLDEIGAAELSTLLVFNKVDLLDEQRANVLRARFPEALFLSAVTNVGVGSLCERIESEFESRRSESELLIPYSEGAALAQLHELAGDLEQEHRADGVYVKAMLPQSWLSRYEKFEINGADAPKESAI